MFGPCDHGSPEGTVLSLPDPGGDPALPGSDWPGRRWGRGTFRSRPGLRPGPRAGSVGSSSQTEPPGTLRGGLPV